MSSVKLGDFFLMTIREHMVGCFFDFPDNPGFKFCNFLWAQLFDINVIWNFLQKVVKILILKTGIYKDKIFKKRLSRIFR